MDDLKAYSANLRTVTLTNEQWNRLSCYLLLTTSHRTGERDAWLSLAEEKNQDGTPVFENAAKNAAYWQGIIDDIAAIIPKLDGLEA